MRWFMLSTYSCLDTMVPMQILHIALLCKELSESEKMNPHLGEL